jgi:hypothetical protein
MSERIQIYACGCVGKQVFEYCPKHNAADPPSKVGVVVEREDPPPLGVFVADSIKTAEKGGS